MAHLTGSCHCGRIKVAFEPAQPPEALQLRACQCSFCLKHGARTASDPGGRLTFTSSGDAISRYRFGTRSADFIVCRHCGAYVGVVMEIDGRTYGVVNVNTLDDLSPFDRPAERMHYEAETLEARMARRKKVWSPAALVDMTGA
jgi:hypothetical protein